MTAYSLGHPWHYVLGGHIPTISQIRAHVMARSYRGYMASDIQAAADKKEPARSAALRKLKAKVKADLKADLATYRLCAGALRRYRLENPEQTPSCEVVHTNISLKFNHLFNDFAHLYYLEDIASQQLDLFEL